MLESFCSAMISWQNRNIVSFNVVVVMVVLSSSSAPFLVFAVVVVVNGDLCLICTVAVRKMTRTTAALVAHLPLKTIRRRIQTHNHVCGPADEQSLGIRHGIRTFWLVRSARVFVPSTWASATKARAEARCLPLSESKEKRGSYVLPKYALCNGSKDES